MVFGFVNVQLEVMENALKFVWAGTSCRQGVVVNLHKQYGLGRRKQTSHTRKDKGFGAFRIELDKRESVNIDHYLVARNHFIETVHFDFDGLLNGGLGQFIREAAGPTQDLAQHKGAGALSFAERTMKDFDHTLIGTVDVRR